MKPQSAVNIGLLGAFVYVASPVIHVGLDRPRAYIESSLAGKSTHDMPLPYVMRDSALLFTVLADGPDLADPLHYWGAQLSPDMKNCLPDDVASSYTGALNSLLADKSECLSEITGVDRGALIPQPEDGYAYERYMRNQSEAEAQPDTPAP